MVPARAVAVRFDAARVSFTEEDPILFTINTSDQDVFEVGGDAAGAVNKGVLRDHGSIGPFRNMLVGSLYTCYLSRNG